MYNNKTQIDLTNNYFDHLLSDQPYNLYEPIRYILRQKGKKIRFYLTLKACGLFSGDDKKALPVAGAIEIFHNFTLVHDDIMDQAVTRRNQPTVHKKWDINTGILSGDAMVILAYESLLQCPKPLLSAVLSIFTQAAREVCEGQQMDMDFETLPAIQMDQYLMMITKKTAVLMAAGLAMGALCGGANREEADHLYDFGVNLGVSFQIRDDLLDCYGTTRKVGKMHGGDILQGKKTILYIRTWFSLPMNERDEFERLYQSSDPNKIERVMEFFEKVDVQSYVRQKEEEYFDNAMISLNRIDLPKDRKTAIIEYSRQLLGRDH